MFPAGSVGSYQCRQTAQTIRLPIATKRTGSNHVSNNRWNVKGGFFTGAVFRAGFFDVVLFIRSTRLSAGLPLEVPRASRERIAQLILPSRSDLAKFINFQGF